MDYERNESKEHRKVKRFLYNRLKKDNLVSAIHTEKRLTNMPKGSEIEDQFCIVPDVYAELLSGERIAIEYQKSITNGIDLAIKVHSYQDMGIFVNYIFGVDNHLIGIDPKNKWIRGISEDAGSLSYLFKDLLYFAECPKKQHSKTHIWRVRIEEENPRGYPSDTFKEFKIKDSSGEVKETEVNYCTVRISAERLDKLVLIPEISDLKRGVGELIARKYLIAKFK